MPTATPPPTLEAVIPFIFYESGDEKQLEPAVSTRFYVWLPDHAESDWLLCQTDAAGKLCHSVNGQADARQPVRVMGSETRDLAFSYAWAPEDPGEKLAIKRDDKVGCYLRKLEKRTLVPGGSVAFFRVPRMVEYVVVGSGAGGGPVAANLALAGKRVLLLEAGGDESGLVYDVPAFHGISTEDPDMRWDFFVKHYEDSARRHQDPKLTAEKDGVLYPRAGTLGGCTAHNAMITVYPHNADWDRIAQLTGDATWGASHMRGYFERLERCTYITNPGTQNVVERAGAGLLHGAEALLHDVGVGGAAPSGKNPSRHGFAGWLTTSEPPPTLAIRDLELLTLVGKVAVEALAEHIGCAVDTLEHRLDPNDWQRNLESPEGITTTPLAVNGGKRNGTRERIRAVATKFPQRLIVRTLCLATKVLFEDPAQKTRATGVEYLQGARVYKADPRAAGGGVKQRVLVRREVILSGGAFNTPQILKLSGVGPAAELGKFGIPVVKDLPGVGENLQDRYEVGVISEMARDFVLLNGAKFAPPAPGDPVDPALSDWRAGRGVYTTNGVVLAIIKRSKRERPLPDLYVFGVPGYFKGYFPGYSKLAERQKNFFTWAILKAHTNNTAGSVLLKSGDPTDVPDVIFRYFDEGNDRSGEDLESVAEGIDFARRMNARMGGIVKKELVPGPDVKTRADVEGFVKREAWGHHASCTCKIGADSDPKAVLDGRFRVRGTTGLRVVDASVFPWIPGFFIVTAIYMIAEKASDVILEDAAKAG